MADQDFNIKVVTTADTTGLRQTSQELDKLETQQATFAETARRQAAATATTKPPLTDNVGFAGAAVGVGTIVTVLTAAINKWKEFNAEQDRWIDGMIKAEAKARELGEAILDMQDKARSAARVGTEPLALSFERLQQDLAVLKTEQSLLNLPEQGEEWKKLQGNINLVESQLKGVTSELQKQSAAAQKAAQDELAKRVPGLSGEQPIKEADAQTQRILQNEQAAAKAKAEGRDADAEMFQRSADQYKASATPQQLADLQRIHDLQDKLKTAVPVAPRRQPEPGEPGGGEVGTGGEAKFTAEDMRQHQLDARAGRYQGVQQTRVDSNEAMMKRLDEIAELQRRQLALWGQ